MKSNVYLASKPRYEILDGLRGVAAVLVVAYHLFETYYHGGTSQPINHGYLAVDFFFVLSGFVIGYAYDDRWDRMSTWGFVKRRLIRLHPMVIFGSLFGAALFYFGDCSSFPLIGDTPWIKSPDYAMGIYHDSHTHIDGHPWMGRNQSLERSGMVIAMGISCQFLICRPFQTLFTKSIGCLCGTLRYHDPRALPEH